MIFSEYIELRARSAFSFLAGASLPEDLIERAAAFGYPALGLGDCDGVYGAPRFHQAATRAGLRAIIGTELTLARAQHAASTLYLLAASRTGYQNLCRLITQTKLRAPKGEAVTTWEDLDGYTDGLICLAGGADGPIAGTLRGEPPPQSSPTHGSVRRGGSLSSVVCHLLSLFPGRLYIDVQRHFDPDEERLNRTLIAVAGRYKIRLVATNDVRHAMPADRRLLDVLSCIRHKTTLDAAGRTLLKNAERHLKPPAEMAALFHDLPEALINTQRIAEQCEFTLADLGYHFPDFPLPPGETPMSYLRALTDAGARERYGTITPRVRRQLEHELRIIGKLELAGYFLIVWDIVRFCRAQRILAQGRGSAANSAVCYALGITAVDAVGMELLFERFLSEERGEWPDIDIDLPSGDQREKVIQYVYQRYGERGAAMTANVITYRTRSAVREVGKVLGFSLEQVDRLSKLLNRFEFRDDMDELAKQLKAGGVDPGAPRVGLLVDLVRQIQHLPRHLGQHSGGMVIAAGRLDTVVPLEPAAMPGRVVVQWDKDDCATLGIIKVDLLGLGMMAVLEEAIPLVKEHEGRALDLAHLPPDDPHTYAMLRAADTIGVFQVESRAQMATLPRMKPERFYDLVVEVAIIRPGPIVGQMVHPYLNRRNRREPVTYAHPDLEPILKRTLGVPLFQEQLLRMAMTLAGFTGGEAEELRRAMGFKRSVERMQDIEARLRAGMAARGIAGKPADDIIRSITSFALYGFPESHAASFALLAYASAYLRAHHLAAFTCAMLNNWPLGFYHPATLVKDAQRHGLRVLPIDVMRSGWKCTLERESPVSRPPMLRLGLRYVTGLRAAAAQRIEAERARAPFTSVADVAARCQLRDNELETLAHLGAFAAFGLTRRIALWQAAAVPRGALFEQQSKVRSAAPSAPTIDRQLSTIDCPLPEMSALDRTLADYKNSGMTVGPHVMKHLRAELAGDGVLRAIDLKHARDGGWAKIAGLVIVRQRPGTAKGFCFITLEDETGTANAVVVPDMFQRYRSVIHTAALLCIEGPLQRVDDVIHVRARRLRALSMPQHAIQQRGSGYRMRTTPEDEPPSMPKSHDFR
ncbi:MAG TPA: error-prone DNA polymerase [Candidatus Acidoferrales bacterium]|nr:error-prone DNA polymerase [Candidatus Acidoferrales bacterium]